MPSATIAAELYTAAIFHLMRVAEYGLRAIAREVGARPVYNKKKVPIEEGDWEKVIAAINVKIKQARELSRAGKKRRAKLADYSDAADHCTFMKDVWRNNTSHTQPPNTEADALYALSRVRDFMIYLTRILRPRKS